MQAGGLGTWHWDLRSGRVSWDETLEELHGLEPGSFDGTIEGHLALLHPDDAARVMEQVAAAAREQDAAFETEYRIIWPDGTVRWLLSLGEITVDSAGELAGAIGCSADITHRHAVEQERSRWAAAVESSAERLRFLTSVNDALASSLDRHEVLSSVTAAAVPRLGDWCAIYVLTEDGSTVLDSEIAHVDPERVRFARELEAQFPYDSYSTRGLMEIVRLEETQFLAEIREEEIADDDLRKIAGLLGVRSALIVPLRAGGRQFGAMQFAMSQAERRYSSDDVALAEAAAGRVAAALGNLFLYDRQRSIARALQSSLLPASLPDIPGVEVAVRYWAVGEATEVGGDFYDVFPLGADRWALVVGDVCGTGPFAAALTSAARYTIRAVARRGAEHREVLESLNEALLAEESDLFVTALYATLEQRGRGWELVVVLGGHPRPIVVGADGSGRTIGAHGAILGVLEEVWSSQCREALGPGDTFVAYTDGVTDVPPPYGLTPDEFEALAVEVVAPTATAEEAADALGAAITEILPVDQREDDIAIVVVRIGSADRPRAQANSGTISSA